MPLTIPCRRGAHGRGEPTRREASGAYAYTTRTGGVTDNRRARRHGAWWSQYAALVSDPETNAAYQETMLTSVQPSSLLGTFGLELAGVRLSVSFEIALALEGVALDFAFV